MRDPFRGSRAAPHSDRPVSSASAQLFVFAQMELPWQLGPPDGRYLLRDCVDPDAPPAHVIVFATLGAPERFDGRDPALSARAREEASAGRRVLGFGRFRTSLATDHSQPSFPNDAEPLGLVVLAERLRPNAAETVAFFTSQNVELKVLSGDAPATVGAMDGDIIAVIIATHMPR